MTTLNEWCQSKEVSRADSAFATSCPDQPAALQVTPRPSFRRAPATAAPAGLGALRCSMFETELMVAWAGQ